jgi:hypothetical protein
MPDRTVTGCSPQPLHHWVAERYAKALGRRTKRDIAGRNIEPARSRRALQRHGPHAKRPGARFETGDDTLPDAPRRRPAPAAGTAAPGWAPRPLPADSGAGSSAGRASRSVLRSQSCRAGSRRRPPGRAPRSPAAASASGDAHQRLRSRRVLSAKAAPLYALARSCPSPSLSRPARSVRHPAGQEYSARIFITQRLWKRRAAAHG